MISLFLLLLVATIVVVTAAKNDIVIEESKETLINQKSSNANEKNGIGLHFKKENNVDVELKCHYPFSHLFRWPVYVTKYGIVCNKDADSFEFVDEISNSREENPSISIDRKTGLLTITPGNAPIAIQKTIACHSGTETYKFEILIDAVNNIDTPGIHFNYTSFLQHNCHLPWYAPKEPRKSNSYTPTFHGYKDLAEFGDLFPALRFLPYTIYFTWNMTIEEDDSYNFYIDTYDTAQLFIDEEKVVVDGFQVCSDSITHLNGTIHLNKGRHSFLAYIESFTDSKSSAFFLIYYGKTHDPMNRYPLPAMYYDDLYEPLLGLSSDKTDYVFLKDAVSSIALNVEEGYRLNCSCEELLPKGLEFNWDFHYIEGKPEETQEKKYYHISCSNIQSVTNVIEISIEVRENLRPGLIAYYSKAKGYFDEYCFTIYDPERDDSELYIRRHEYTTNHYATAENGRFPDVPIDMNGEFSLVMKGYIKIKKTGRYRVVYKNSDSYAYSIGDNIGSHMLVCRDVVESGENRDIEAGIYPFYLGYTNNFYEPYLEFNIMLGNETADYEFVYMPDQEIEYNYTAATYHFNETIIPNRILNPPQNIKKVVILPNLPDGLAINATTGEISGILLIENMDLTKYTVTIETDDSKYTTIIEIRLKNFIIPGGFYIHDLLTGKDYYDESPKFKHGTKVDFEIYNKEGVVTEYRIYNSIPGLTANTSNGHLRMKGVTSSSYNLIDFNYKASDGKHFNKTETVIYLESMCEENEKVHIFTYITSNEESSVRIEMTSVDGSSHNQILLSYMKNETYLCLIPSEYRFYINNITNEFHLNLTVDGKVVISKNYYPFRIYDEVLTTEYQKTTIAYNNGESVNLKLYEEFILYPEITGCIYQFKEPYPLRDTIQFDYETGVMRGYYTEIKYGHLLFFVEACDGSSIEYKLPLIVEENTYLNCNAKGKITLEIEYHFEDEEVMKYMSFSISGSNGKEAYSSNLYKNKVKEDRSDVICLTDDDYTLHLYDGNPKLEGWKNGYIIIKLNKLFYDKYTVEKSTHLKNVPLHLHSYLHSKIQWSYSYHYLENYYKFDIKDDWSVSLFDKIPKTTTNTTYIRYYFDVNKSTPFVSALISFNYLSGIIVYINEKLIYKDNMDYKEYDENTPASDYNDLITNVKFLIPLDLIESERTLIAVELHKHESELKYPHFNLTINLLDDHNGCTDLSDYSGFVKNYYPKNMGLYNTNVTNVFLNNNQYWATSLPEGFESGNDDIEIEYNFGEYNYFYPNEVYIESYAEDDDENYTVNGNPKSINIQGRDSTTSSTTNLIKVNDLNLNAKRISKYIRFFGNSNGFNTIRFNISSVNNASGIDNDQMNINKLKLLGCRNSYCNALDNLPTTNAGDIVSVECKNDPKTSKIFECMNGVNPRWKEIENYCEEEPMILQKVEEIVFTKSEYNSELIGEFSGMNLLFSSNPELPKCLSLEDGLIRGKCDDLMNRTEYNITIKNDYGEIKMTVHITIKEPDYPVINMKSNSISINSGVLYSGEKIFDVVGNNLYFMINPSLPKGIILTSNGLLKGLLEEEIDNVEYLLTIRNENRTVYYPINIIAKLPESPNIVNMINRIDFHYGINYQNLSLYNIYGKSLKYSNKTVLPSDLKIDENTGILKGEIKSDKTNNNELMIIKASTGSQDININIEYSIKAPSVPTLISYTNEVDINVGEDISIITSNVVGENLVYSINNLPEGLKIDKMTGKISGMTLDISNIKRQCRVNVVNSNGYIFYDITLNLLLPKKPIIEEIYKESVFVPSVEIKPFTLVKALGENVIYEIEPELPEGIKLVNVNGIIYGKPNEVSNITNYKLIIKSSYESISEDIIIRINGIYCEADGKWPKTMIGEVVEIPCDGEGIERRECLLIDGKGVWGEIDSNCSSVSYGTLVVLVSICSITIIGLISIVMYKHVRKAKITKNEEEINLEKPLL